MICYDLGSYMALPWSLRSQNSLIWSWWHHVIYGFHLVCPIPRHVYSVFELGNQIGMW